MQLSHHIRIKFTFYEMPCYKSVNHFPDTDPCIFIVHNPPVILSLDKKKDISIEDVQATLKYVLLKNLGINVESSSLKIYPLTGKDIDEECETKLKRLVDCSDYAVIFQIPEDNTNKLNNSKNEITHIL